jgi:hypothetical protein
MILRGQKLANLASTSAALGPASAASMASMRTFISSRLRQMMHALINSHLQNKHRQQTHLGEHQAVVHSVAAPPATAPPTKRIEARRAVAAKSFRAPNIVEPAPARTKGKEWRRRCDGMSYPRARDRRPIIRSAPISEWQLFSSGSLAS